MTPEEQLLTDILNVVTDIKHYSILIFILLSIHVAYKLGHSLGAKK